MRRFILHHKWAIENSPLQVYASALVFSPARSLTKELFTQEEPEWVTTKPTIEDDWNAVLQTLEGHSGWVWSVAFSHDSKLLASASYDQTVKIWDASTGSCQQTVAVNPYVTNLSFDSIYSNLFTNVGGIKVDRTGLLTMSEYPQEGGSKGDRQGLGISGSWVTWNADNLLWLPPDYRAAWYNISPSRSIVAGGCTSGKVFIIGFSLAILCKSSDSYKSK